MSDKSIKTMKKEGMSWFTTTTTASTTTANKDNQDNNIFLT